MADSAKPIALALLRSLLAYVQRTSVVYV